VRRFGGDANSSKSKPTDLDRFDVARADELLDQSRLADLPPPFVQRTASCPYAKCIPLNTTQ
jgi:hypothetical protein